MRAFVEKQAGKLSKLGLKITHIRVFLENVARKKVRQIDQKLGIKSKCQAKI
jgi:hypothetical protein